MSKQILPRLSKVTLVDQIIHQLQDVINMNADGEKLPFSGFHITLLTSEEIHFKFSVSGKNFNCSITWQKFLANQVLLNQIKLN